MFGDQNLISKLSPIDLVLADLVVIFHPHLLPNHELLFFKKQLHQLSIMEKLKALMQEANL